MAIRKVKTLLPRWLYSQCGDGPATGAAFPLAANAKTYRYFFLAQMLDSLLKTRWMIFWMETQTGVRAPPVCGERGAVDSGLLAVC